MSSTEGKPIKCKAFVCWETKKPLTLEEIEVAPPKDNEVRIKIINTALCHTDVYSWSGLDSELALPAILGHEGCGVVESIGSQVTSVKPGDVVIPLYTPECKKCKFCTSGKTNLCIAIRATQGKGLMPDSTTRFTCKGKTIYHFMGISTFSEYTVCPEISVCKVDSNVLKSEACLLGCGVTTGFYGAQKNIESDANVVVFGLGTVGLAVVQGAKAKGAKRIVGVDINPNKEKQAREFGLTDFVNPKDLKEGETVHGKLVEMLDGGADYAFECVGNTDLMKTALLACHRGWGKLYVIGVAAAGTELKFAPFLVVTGRSVHGIAFGGVKGRSELPQFVRDFCIDRKYQIREYITHRLKFEDLNKAFDILHQGECLRAVMYMNDEDYEKEKE